jgi:hypothetical protein
MDGVFDGDGSEKSQQVQKQPIELCRRFKMFAASWLGMFDVPPL